MPPPPPLATPALHPTGTDAYAWTVSASLSSDAIVASPSGSAAAASLDSLPERAPPLSRTELWLILGFWTLIAVLTSANALIEPRAGHPWQPVVPLSGLLLAFANAYMWALLTPPIFALTSRYTIERSSWTTRVMFVITGLALAVLVDMATSFLRSQLYHATGPLSPELMAIARVRRLWFMNDFVVYVAVLAAGIARNYFLRYRVRREEAGNLKAQAAQLQAQLADARLAALRSQLNPHFLFNTLHAVSALVERDPRGVRRMVARLSELLRTSLDEADEPEISLDRELKFSERYLDIMQIRFQGNLQVSLRIEPDVRDALVPNLILQPLVENAVKHGVSKLEEMGRIEIVARRLGERVVLSVRDNGPAFSVAKSSDGLGLRNTRARLAQLYGAEQSLTLRPAPGGGLVAEVSLPFHTRADLHTPGVAASA